jgi:hypothetical protein
MNYLTRVIFRMFADFNQMLVDGAGVAFRRARAGPPPLLGDIAPKI